jgi:hypothetical protein
MTRSSWISCGKEHSLRTGSGTGGGSMKDSRILKAETVNIGIFHCESERKLELVERNL